ncbi:hypothetical protein F5144DRAFT_564968, partial [Chaetomium tenue]
MFICRYVIPVVYVFDLCLCAYTLTGLVRAGEEPYLFNVHNRSGCLTGLLNRVEGILLCGWASNNQQKRTNGYSLCPILYGQVL